MPAPEGFIIPTTGISTGNAGILKAVTGAIGTQAVRFYVHKVYNAKKSEELGYEFYDDVELCGFKNDKYAETAIMVKDLSMKQKMDTARIYERFKTQKDSTDTPLEKWAVISESQKAFYLQMGIHSVEQLASFQEHELFRLGPDGKNVRDLALRHINGKELKKQEDRNKEMELVIKENRVMSEKIKKLEEAYFASQAEKAAQAKKLGRPPLNAGKSKR